MGETPTENQDAGASAEKILDQATMDSILKSTFIKGQQEARFLIFEYSDLLCPFCQRHHNDKTLLKVQEKYPNDVALVFKNMPLAQLHPTAPK
jgi:protein-disulfide isomerase